MSLESYIKITTRVDLIASFDDYSIKTQNNCMIVIIKQLNYRILYALIKFINDYEQFRRNFLRSLLINDLKECFKAFHLNCSVINAHCKSRLRILSTNLYISDVIIRTWLSITLRYLNQKRYYEANWAYLSTLGGAYSSLGEENLKHAQSAERTSIKQLKIAIEYGDPIAIVRCKFYLVLSKIQLKQFKDADLVLKSAARDIQIYSKIEYKLYNMFVAIQRKLKCAKKSLKV